MAKLNPLRFSTKYQDDETDLLYYGYRYYNASTGRWLSRDPIEELGGKSLYWFAANDGVNYIDTDGRFTGTKCHNCGQWYQGWHSCPHPLGPTEAGFEMCRRNVLENDWKDRMVNDCCGGLHMFVRQKYFGKDRRPTYRGWGFDKSGPHMEAEAVGRFAPTCAACTKSPRRLQYGDGKDTPANEAKDDEIWDCLTKVPASWGYNTLLYNCRSYAWQSASKCGLDCQSPGQPADRK